MDSVTAGIVIGLPTLIGCGALRYFYELYNRRKKQELQESLMVGNPLLVRKHSKVKNLFV